MNILVVGGAGYVGGAVTDLLMQTNHNVRVYDNLLYEESYRKPIDFVYGDVRDTERLLPQLKWADVVIWLAALVGDGACALNLDISVAVNQESINWLSKHYDGRIVFASTCSVYGSQDSVLDELYPVDLLSVYARTKYNAEKYLEGKNAIVLRLGTLFGVGDLFSRVRLDLVVNIFTVQAHQQGRIKVFGGDQFRSFLHVKDAARAVVESIDKEAVGIFNIANWNMRIIDLANQVRNHFPNLVVEQIPEQVTDARNYRVSSEKARDILGFRGIYSIYDGIGEIKELLNSHRIKDVDNPRYSNQAYLASLRIR